MSTDICPECKYEPPPHTGPGIPSERPGMVHSADCPTLAWLREVAEKPLPKPATKIVFTCRCPNCIGPLAGV